MRGAAVIVLADNRVPVVFLTLAAFLGYTLFPGGCLAPAPGTAPTGALRETIYRRLSSVYVCTASSACHPFHSRPCCAGIRSVYMGVSCSHGRHGSDFYSRVVVSHRCSCAVRLSYVALYIGSLQRWSLSVHIHVASIRKKNFASSDQRLLSSSPSNVGTLEKVVQKLD